MVAKQLREFLIYRRIENVCLLLIEMMPHKIDYWLNKNGNLEIINEDEIPEEIHGVFCGWMDLIHFLIQNEFDYYLPIAVLVLFGS